KALEMRRAVYRFHGSEAGSARSAHDGLSRSAPGQAQARPHASIPAWCNRVAAETAGSGSTEHQRARPAAGAGIGQRRAEVGALIVAIERRQIEFIAHA